MNFIRTTTWEEIFNGWRSREADNPGWINCATKIKGWPDWESWRRFTADQISANSRKWQIFEFTDPLIEIPRMLIGPFSGWQSRVINKNNTTFEELLEIPKQYEHFTKHEGVLSILKGLPFTTEFIGIIREDNNKIVCLEGHHRATAIALAQRQGLQLDFSDSKLTIALTSLPKEECVLLDEVLKRGTTKNPKI
ncbi:MAG: hypothetical protein NTZ49_05755 [Candidatus Parcubacteria bacterium]|nr:hypothetical protein [Candidatus Parcubacteria bacterium]